MLYLHLTPWPEMFKQLHFNKWSTIAGERSSGVHKRHFVTKLLLQKLKYLSSHSAKTEDGEAIVNKPFSDQMDFFFQFIRIKHKHFLKTLFLMTGKNVPPALMAFLILLQSFDVFLFLFLRVAKDLFSSQLCCDHHWQCFKQKWMCCLQPRDQLNRAKRLFKHLD